MQDFLYQSAQRIIKEQDGQLENTLIVLPNRRAALFLKKHLGGLIKNTIWSPTIISTEEFIEDLSATSVIDNVQLLFEFFEVYKKVIPREEQNEFDVFIQWGTTLLQDFNEIDRYLIDPEKIFSYVNEARAIEVWNLELTEITEVQSNYLKFWMQMKELYFSFKKHLESLQLSYPGLSYRTAAENLTNEKIESTPYQHIYFTGFNALTTAEQLIMEKYVAAGKATLLFDSDEYYLNDQIQEAGLFLRQLRKNAHFSTGFNQIGRYFKQKKNITVYSVAKNIGQAKLAGQLLKEVDQNNDFKDTAVVLSDENLLLPVLQSLPEEVGKVNITMGYPISNSPIYTFFERYIHLHLRAERNLEQRKVIAFYNQDLFNLLSHPFIANVSESFSSEKLQTCKENILNANLAYLTIDDLEKWIPGYEEVGIKKTAELSVNFILKRLLKLIEIAKNKLAETDHETKKLEIEYLFNIAKILNQLTDLQNRFNSIHQVSTLYTIFTQLCKQSTIPFFGEPLRGLQLLGVLETRTIDFKNIILLSLNEGVLPSGKTNNSFIPFDIKIQFGLPTHKEKDAIYAYHFYRLIQRAENVSLIYNSSAGKMGGGERSRFIEQLVNELPNYNSDITIKEVVVQTPLPTDAFEDKTIPRNSSINEAILNHLKRGISPSAINTFISCPLDYYYKYVLRLKEPKEVEEHIAANTFGDLIHESLEIAYGRELEGQTIVKEQLTELEKIAKEHCQRLFTENYGAEALKVGKNHLIYSVAQSYIREFFKQEKELLKKHTLRIISVEETLEVPFKFNYKGEEITVSLKGKADRIDEIDGELRIIDYKTGIVDNRKLIINKDFNEIELNKSSQAIQLLVYAYTYAKKHQLKELPTAGILSFRKIKDGLSTVNFGKSFPSTDHLASVEDLLSRIITEMLEKECFEHNSDAKYCKFCHQ